MATMTRRYATVPTANLRVPRGARIRNLQDNNPKYESLKKSIMMRGIEQPIIVKAYLNPETGKIEKDIWEIIDGLQRSKAAEALKLDSVPVDIRENVTDDDIAIIQLVCNEHRIPTSPKDLLEHIKRYMFQHPEMTQREVADQLGYSEVKLGNILKLKNLAPVLMEKVTTGQIKLTHAIALSTLPTENQIEEDVLTNLAMPSDQFINFITAKKDAIKKARAAGEATSGPVVVMIPLRREAMVEKLEIARIELKECKPEEPDFARLSGRVEMAEEMLQVDPHTLAEKELEKKKRQAERAKEKADKAAQVAKEVLADVQKQAASIEAAEGNLADSLA